MSKIKNNGLDQYGTFMV